MTHDNSPTQAVANNMEMSRSTTPQARAVEKAKEAVGRQLERRRNSGASGARTGTASWKRETRTLPRVEAREFARTFFRKYPKAAYWSEVESWRVLDDDVIEFTMRRLPTAD